VYGWTDGSATFSVLSDKPFEKPSFFVPVFKCLTLCSLVPAFVVENKSQTHHKGINGYHEGPQSLLCLKKLFIIYLSMKHQLTVHYLSFSARPAGNLV
jgi:hypothetical protein